MSIENINSRTPFEPSDLTPKKQRTDEVENPLWDLPDELTLHIFSYLGTSDLGRIGKTCKKGYFLSDDPTLWTVWRSGYKQRFPNIFREVNDVMWKTLFVANTSLEKAGSFAAVEEIPSVISSDIYDFNMRWIDYSGKKLTAFSHKNQNYISFEISKDTATSVNQTFKMSSALNEIVSLQPENPVLCVRFINDCLVKVELHFDHEKHEKQLIFSDVETEKFYKLIIPTPNVNYEAPQSDLTLEFPFHFEIIEDNLFFVLWQVGANGKWLSTLNRYKINTTEKTLTFVSSDRLGIVCRSWIISDRYFINFQNNEVLCFDWKNRTFLGEINHSFLSEIKMEILNDSLYILTTRSLIHCDLSSNLKERTLINIPPEIHQFYTCFKIVGSTAFLFGRTVKNGEPPHFTQIYNLKDGKIHTLEGEETDHVREAFVVNGQIVTFQRGRDDVDDQRIVANSDNMLVLRNFEEIQN